MSGAVIRLWADLPGTTINPNIYGHFAEHLGRCVYEGIWVGHKSPIPNEGGLRLDVLAALKQLRAPVVRWPGGCFADMYHWRDGIGSKKERPQTVNIWWRQAEPNRFGTDEFIRFCQAVGCQPYICANVGTGSPREALEWLEYCNFGGDSTLSRARAINDGAKPHGVRYWGIGNENWGCGGRYAAADYAKEFIRYGSFMKALDPSIELIACGCSPMDGQNPAFASWNHDFCNAMPHADLIDHLSLHRYFGRGDGIHFTESEYQALFVDLVAMERDLQLADAVLRYFYPDKQVGLAVDEWGVWHPSAIVDNGLEQANTLRDAVFAGAALNLFNRYAHRVSMANIAQTINVLQCLAMTDKARMVLTPTYHVYDMMRPHMGARLLTQEVESPLLEGHPVGLHKTFSTPALSASASIAAGKILLTVANQTWDQDIETRIDLRGTKAEIASGRILNASSPRDVNTFDAPKTVMPKRIRVEASHGEWVHVFPAHSFTALSLTLA
ncbi:MAG TPA: alpha-L-arabinofuranosidase C-terminal domain-containing protein [Candidatus Hydrogenedentes bacterium]|nr:alpha-L-arabinofuranosidase C-terminal domain-containing protein [Candidatus Hydrogenedentota bacterium]HRT20218.1 alpha-L-arabinofuranosidase C-terminal domain-containing protein [Candidatus Hydrogenedentota bacterium]HRT64280.1 alpha-L-arabinofuranosidase C-terminal domain-containing protein [Candidatus Hydrogenedentota bacterium]